MISDATIAHLRELAQQPDLTATPYTITREIARGGMAVVYEAVDARLGRPVALKVLALEISSPRSAERMREEARMIARLEHPGIVPIHDIGTLPDGRVFYTMKLVRGSTLGELACAQPGRATLLRLFLRICDAVAFAHASGVVHRDLKPGNIMVGSFGEVLVMDWGVAAATASSAEIAGTDGFIAPEQLRGALPNPRADVFALGAILAELVAAQPEPISKPLRSIAQKATEIEAEARYQSVSDLAAEIIRFLDDQTVHAYRENAIERAVRWIRRNRALVAIVAAYIAMRAVVLFWVRR